MKYFLIIMVCLGCGIWFISGCEKGTIDSLYTNPDAIVDLLQIEAPALEAADCGFLEAGAWHNLGAALSGNFGTLEYLLNLDSSLVTYDVNVGDTVYVDYLWAKEANAYTQFKNHYSLILKNAVGDSVIKHLVTNPIRAKKQHYLLQLGNFSGPLRGWVFWATTPILNLSDNMPNLSWSSNRQGSLAVSDDTIVRSGFITFAPGERITVQYRGQSEDIAFLNLNETGTWERIKFKRINDALMEVDWTVSDNFGGKDYYYYAGIEIYRGSTLASNDTTKTTFFFTGLMYQIGEE